jgi:cytochrome d ubiquinol oxidase subunit I
MVALGASFSAFWILAANSWMQTPAGYAIAADGKFAIASWWEAIFTPSLNRFAHMVVAAYIAGTFVVLGVHGFYLRQRRHLDFARAGFSLALWLAHEEDMPAPALRPGVYAAPARTGGAS